MRHKGIPVTLLGAVIAGAIVMASSGCGSGGGSAARSAAPARTASLVGRLAAPAGVTPAGTRVVAELVIGGRTATLRAISAASDAARRNALIDAAQSGDRTTLPGVYETVAMGDGSFVFRNLPEGDYSLIARHDGMVAVLPDVHVAGAQTQAPRTMRLAAEGSINGTVRFAHPNETNPDNSGILAYVKGTSLVGYSAGSSGAYTIPKVPQQSETDQPYTVGTIAGGFADDELQLFERLTGTSVNAPLIFLQLGASISGRISDPTISVIDRQGLANVPVVAVTGQSAVTDENGFFSIRGLKPGFNHLTITRSNYRTIRQQIGPLEAGINSYFSFALQRQ